MQLLKFLAVAWTVISAFVVWKLDVVDDIVLHFVQYQEAENEKLPFQVQMKEIELNREIDTDKMNARNQHNKDVFMMEARKELLQDLMAANTVEENVWEWDFRKCKWENRVKKQMLIGDEPFGFLQLQGAQQGEDREFWARFEEEDSQRFIEERAGYETDLEFEQVYNNLLELEAPQKQEPEDDEFNDDCVTEL